jgi:hypothetical protein
MPKRTITTKRESAKYEIRTNDDMILVDEYPDQTYRLYIPGDYKRDEVDKDFATVNAIRDFIGLDVGEERTGLQKELKEVREKIKELKIQEEDLLAATEQVVDIEEMIPGINARQKLLLDGMLRIIGKDDSYLHKIWSDVRSIGLNENGVQMMGPYPVIPDREEDGEESE